MVSHNTHICHIYHVCGTGRQTDLSETTGSAPGISYLDGTSAQRQRVNLNAVSDATRVSREGDLSRRPADRTRSISRAQQFASSQRSAQYSKYGVRAYAVRSSC